MTATGSAAGKGDARQISNAMKARAAWSGVLLTLGRPFAFGKETSSSIFKFLTSSIILPSVHIKRISTVQVRRHPLDIRNRSITNVSDLSNQFVTADNVTVIYGKKNIAMTFLALAGRYSFLFYCETMDFLIN
jgi:hypothetical protein